VPGAAVEDHAVEDHGERERAPGNGS